MEEGFGSGLILLLVGMSTAFLGLALVVLFGNWLIVLTNKLAPTAKVAVGVEKTPELVASPIKSMPTSDVSPKHLAVILAAVEAVTEGKGYVEKVARK